MSQRTFLRELDAQIVGSLRGAGMVDTGVYTPPGGGAPIADVDVLVDRNVALYDAEGVPIDSNRVLVTLFLDQVSAPVEYATVTIGAEVFKLSRPDARDESMSRWVVTGG